MDAYCMSQMEHVDLLRRALRIITDCSIVLSALC